MIKDIKKHPVLALVILGAVVLLISCAANKFKATSWELLGPQIRHSTTPVYSNAPAPAK